MMFRLHIRVKKSTAVFMMALLLAELLSPTISFALTSGPSQPEMQSFEPVGTTDMVNAFSGDFVYNIPLLDVDGYPINISYHSGITAEEEASWVGLGWNINPGNIGRGVRGLPDDFDGDTVAKEIDITPELKKRFGVNLGFELAGFDLNKVDKAAKLLGLKMSVGGSLNMGIDISNYSGVSASIGFGTNGAVRNDYVSAGVNLGATFTTDNGVDLNKSMSVSGNTSKSAGAVTTTITGSFGKGYNSREGLKYTSFGVNPSFSYRNSWSGKCTMDKPADKKHYRVNAVSRPEGVSNTVVPISMQNFVPVITNASFAESRFFQFKLGIEFPAAVYPNFGGSYGEDKIQFDKDGSRRAYGFFNLQDASKEDVTDFTRDRDGRFNRDMQYLPSGTLAYDIYSVNGQGTAGNFRGFRNDIGTVYDPYVSSFNDNRSDLVEAGIGNIFEAGWDNVNAYTASTSGPWNKYKKSFSGKKPGSLYEPHYFKQAGELSEASPEMIAAIKGSKALTTDEAGAINSSPLENASVKEARTRVKRSNLLYYYTAAEARNKGVSLQPQIENFPDTGSLYRDTISRIGGFRKAHQASEFTQLLPDGKRYIYGIPAMNNVQQEYVISQVGPGSEDGTINVPQYAKPGGGQFGQQMFMKTSTPAYAHSYLLSSILSPDYSDLTGDGITDDDIGSYTKFNYTLKASDYQWRTPYLAKTGQFDEGVASDCHDDKATFVAGTKEIWMLHSVESKNYVALFYTSPRKDGIGSKDTSLPGTLGSPSYKLDSIKLYNRRDRIADPYAAIPIKTVVFTYDYSLCKNIPNSESPGSSIGKLTLRAISIKFGNSDAGYLSPYRFSYDGLNPNYNPGQKDMWGSYKPNNANWTSNLTNHQFPYVRQDSVQAALNASAWNLTKILLPSGGSIKVTYESDDYAYVQNRRSMEMFQVKGVGGSREFVAGNSLYQSQTNPYLFVYFDLKNSTLYNDFLKTYLDNSDIVQYNFMVKMSANGETTPSCNIPLEDHVKGYAKVVRVGDCGDGAHGYIQLDPKTVNKMPGLGVLNLPNISLNPITLSAIFYAKYYNSKALYPSSEILTLSTGALIKQLIASFSEISDYFRSPIAKYLKEERAKYINLDQSYLRLCSQGKKLGGGHRVKRIEFQDSWSQVSSSGQPVATYGSEYDYTTVETGRRISSGVVTYEPLFGGDENPFKEPIATDRIGQKNDFPVVIPTELTVEGPIGESMYPSPDVGYNKVTITSINKSRGASSQTVHEHEFYTAKDFPVRVENTQLERLEDKQIKALDLSFNKKEAFRVGQGYSLFFNDMHGKPKRESVSIASTGAGTPQLVSYKKYEYFTNDDHTLKNDVMCMYADENDSLVQGTRTLGVETDFMLDSREKYEKNSTTGFMINLNVFMIGIFPVPIPTAFPKIPRSVEKTFSSVVSTKITQQYGILKSVETFDKGATIVLSNEVFDALTGVPLVTKVNTEFKDFELNVKHPAYWAYTGMGPAYRNILYEEQLSDRVVTIVNDTCYFSTDHPERFNRGDELLLTVNESCWKSNQTPAECYKLWVVDKNKDAGPIPPTAGTCMCTDTVVQKGSGYSLFGAPLSVGKDDPRYEYSTDSTNWSIAKTISHPWNLTNIPWIGHSSMAYQGNIWFKTTITVPSGYTGPIWMRLGIDSKDACGTGSYYSVNGVKYPIPNVLPNHYTQYFKLNGLASGGNQVVIKFCDASAPLGLSTAITTCAPTVNAIVALPIKRGAESAEGMKKTFPTFGRISDATIKVVRSGRRNQLQETVQDLAAQNKTGAFNYNLFAQSTSTYSGVISTGAKTYTEAAAQSDSTSFSNTAYNNPYVTGRLGNYRIDGTFGVRLNRNYGATTDQDNGLMNAVTSFWNYASSPDDYHAYLTSPSQLIRTPPGGVTKSVANPLWIAQASVKNYSPWGNDLEVRDAAGNIQSNLFGYNNTLPIASVKNSEWDNSLYEGFEDFDEPSSILAFYQNEIHRLSKVTQSGNGVVRSARHTGKCAYSATGSMNFTLPISASKPSSYPSGALYPFHFRPGKKYIISYWQSATQNTANLTSAGKLSLTIGSTTVYLYAKTPVIEGWVLYEAEVTIPATAGGINATVNVAGAMIDDVRIIPSEANMKSYVYDYKSRRLVATLDENHMASFFEYDAEGKLTRIKKETERGILTLKESRGSLHSIINTSNGNGSKALTQSN